MYFVRMAARKLPKEVQAVFDKYTVNKIARKLKKDEALSMLQVKQKQTHTISKVLGTIQKKKTFHNFLTPSFYETRKYLFILKHFKKMLILLV